jgi:hypothetical protein
MSDDKSMSRKEFMSSVGKVCICSCACAVATSLGSVYAQDTTKQATTAQTPEPSDKPRSQERIEFTEKWAVRFFDALDANLDKPTRKKIMIANGKACLLAWQKETSQTPRSEPVTLERFTTWAKELGTQRRSQVQVQDDGVVKVEYLRAIVNQPAKWRLSGNRSVFILFTIYGYQIEKSL